MRKAWGCTEDEGQVSQARMRGGNRSGDDKRSVELQENNSGDHAEPWKAKLGDQTGDRKQVRKCGCSSQIWFLCWWILKFFYHWGYSLKYPLIKDVSVWEGNRKLFARLVPGGLALGGDWAVWTCCWQRELAVLRNMIASVRLSPFFSPPPTKNSWFLFLLFVF